MGKSITFEVRGAEPIRFEEGWMTGDMEEPGLEIAAPYKGCGFVGGCINREEAKQLYLFLRDCLSGWKRETQ